MSRICPRLVLVALCCCTPGVAFADSRPAKAPPSLCTTSEKVVFGCAQGRRIISLCAMPSAKRPGTIQLRYAFGTPNKIELEISQASFPNAFFSGLTSISGGGIDYVRVQNGTIGYVLYTGMRRGWAQDGWVVEDHGEPISHHICKTVATGNDVWGPVYDAKLAKSLGSNFLPPEWVGNAPRRTTR